MNPEPFPAPGSLTPAEAVFAQYLADLDVAGTPDFEACCRAHPDLAPALRELKADWERHPVFAHLADLAQKRRAPLAAEPHAYFGDRVDPDAPSGAKQPEQDSSPSSELLKRLRAHAPANSRYRMLGEIGRGGMGAVLRIWDEDLRRVLAMKVVLGQEKGAEPADTPAVDARTLGRFLEEAQVTGQLDHPGIVPVHELGLASDGRVYFTMRLVKGEDLRKILEHVRSGHDGWNPTRALGVLLKVCEAMSYAHDKGVVHRDLKPANVMVGKYGEVYVMDWGLARVLGTTDQHDMRVRPEAPRSASVRTERQEERADSPDSPIVTMDGEAVGTPAYMPPEQARGDVALLGPRSDVYALGAMLYHLITGQMPFVPPGVRVSAYAVLMRLIEGPPKPLLELAPETPAELVAICERAMERDPERRYRDMVELAEDLRAYLERRVVKAYEQGAWAETKKWMQRNRPLAAAVGAGLLVLLAGIVSVSVIGRQLTVKNSEATRLRNDARSREHESRMLGLITEIAHFETLDDDVYAYARQQTVPAWHWWLESAHAFIDGVAEDPTYAESWRPGLSEVEAELVTLRARARERTADERAQDRVAHPREREHAALEAKAAWYARRLSDAPQPRDDEVLRQLAKVPWPATAEALNDAAWTRVDPDAARPGNEWEGLLLARNAVRLASDAQRPWFRDTLAWALFRTGQLDDALAEERKAVDEEAALAQIANPRSKEVSPDEPHVHAPKLPALLARLTGAVADWRETNRAARVAELNALRQELAALDEILDQNRSWRFASNRDAWWHGELVRLADGLRRLQVQLNYATASVRRLEAEQSWKVALQDIATNELYRQTQWPGGTSLTPQLGLVPIGRDPKSGLWEFAHLATGKVAHRGDNGKLLLEPDMGLVFVLLPGGRVPVESGADSIQDQSLTEIDLDPFFISKYEMTESQWERIGGWRRPQPDHDAALWPASDVSWDDCELALSQVGWLSLPTEAQWEYACRARTTSKWWTGVDAEGLRGVANIRFDADKRPCGVATIGTRRANAFGLHDVYGNVCEWCRDARDEDEERLARERERSPRRFPDIFRRSGDGLYDQGGRSNRIDRGGAYCDEAEDARSSGRDNTVLQFRASVDRTEQRGLRPARGITP